MVLKVKSREPNKCPDNGKGDKNRTASFNQFQKNYDQIKWQSPSGSLLNTKYPRQK